MGSSMTNMICRLLMIVFLCGVRVRTFNIDTKYTVKEYSIGHPTSQFGYTVNIKDGRQLVVGAPSFNTSVTKKVSESNIQQIANQIEHFRFRFNSKNYYYFLINSI